MIAGTLGRWIDYLVIGMACWKVGGVFSRNAKFKADLRERIDARTVRPIEQAGLRQRQMNFTRHRVAIESDRGRQETFYDFYRRRAGGSNHVDGGDRGGSPRPRVLMIYHHGMGEVPHDHTFANLFLSDDPLAGVDLVTMKATYHPPHLVPEPNDMYLADASFWVEMVADSVAVAESIAVSRRSEYDGIFLGGISLGGVVTLAALAHRDCFDLYHPMMVGPNLPAQLRHSLFMRFTSPQVVRSLEGDRDLAALNFQAAVEQHAERVHLIAGEFDPVFRIEPIRALAAALPALTVDVLPYAHIAGCLAGELLRRRLTRRWRQWARERASLAAI
ncbi:MAG: hypothetical protein ACREJ2_05515 [Planctomycetota bacterium]